MKLQQRKFRKAASLATLTLLSGVFATAFQVSAASECHKQNVENFEETLNAHMTAISNRDLDALAATMHPDGEMQLVLPDQEVMRGAQAFLDFHKTWFKSDNWTVEGKIVDSRVGCEVGTALTEQMYREPERDGKPYFNRMTVTYVLEKVDDKWVVIRDHAAWTERSTDKPSADKKEATE